MFSLFNRYFLLSLTPMPIWGFQKCGVGRESLFAWPEVFAPAFKYLLADHGAAVAFHRGIVAGS